MLNLSRFLFFVLVVFSLDMYAQKDPEFSKFEGDVYALNFRKIAKGYGSYVYQEQKIGSVSWDEINISDRGTDEPFPDVDRNRLFGMVLHSTMTISEKSCYEFILSSDDGSKLWIDDQIIIDNDKSHEMIQIKKKISLQPGTYKIKIWYHQAYPDRYGFIFDASIASGPCEPYVAKEATPPKLMKFTLSEDISFDRNQYTVKVAALAKLDSIAQLINQNIPKKVNIVGHTDNTGSQDYNKELSEKRALAIQEYLAQKMNTPITFAVRAMGELFPLVSNDTEEGRAKNRRVEIILLQ